jgi:hypothetical protein
MHQQLRNTKLDIALLIVYCDLLDCAQEHSPLWYSTGCFDPSSSNSAIVPARSLASLDRSLVNTICHIDVLQFEMQLVACMVWRCCAHCCKVRVRVHHISAGADIDTCCNDTCHHYGSHLKFDPLIACA